MTNLPKNTVTNDLEKLVRKAANPYYQLWQDFRCGKVEKEKFHKTLREKSLKDVHKMGKEEYPLKPTKKSKENMDGWAAACVHIDCVNAGNKHWLGVLLKDIVEGKLDIQQGKEEEIEELLAKYY